MPADLPHIDASGRGLDDGECSYCGDAGNLESTECHVRLREALDETTNLCRGAEADALAQTRRTRELLDETDRLRALISRARPAVATLAVTLGSNEYPEGKALLGDIDAVLKESTTDAAH